MDMTPNTYCALKPQTIVNNDEIRLSILCQVYNAKFSGFRLRVLDLKLKDIRSTVIDVNLEYLLDKGLIQGGKIQTNEFTAVVLDDITATGIDVVENIMKQSLKNPCVQKEVCTHPFQRAPQGA